VNALIISPTKQLLELIPRRPLFLADGSSTFAMRWANCCPGCPDFIPAEGEHTWRSHPDIPSGNELNKALGWAVVEKGTG